ncbi:ParB/Sulfiredoxin [Baffinella frigidus]|nr:ParB/Sulfiredoxin [Cryptophyta sp. CCMP2293]
MKFLAAPRWCVVGLGALLLLAASEGVQGAGVCDKFDASVLEGSNPKDFCQHQIDSGTPPKQGDVCLSHPEDVFPTQAAFGQVDASCAQKDLEILAAKKDGSLRAELMSKLAPGILGPGGKMYITDHHHLSHAMLSAFLPYAKPMHHRTLYVCVTQIMSDMPEDKFWKNMEENELVWLHDERGNNITPCYSIDIPWISLLTGAATTSR